VKTLTVEEAAELLHLHPVTLKRMAKRGEIPASKPAKRWVFIEIDLVAYLRAQYPPRVMQGAHKEVNICRSTDAQTLPSGGSSCATAEKSYREALGLPIR